MAQILLPESDNLAGSWNTTPLWSKVDDDSTVSPSGDGTAITSDNNTSPDNAIFTLTDGTDPASSTGHILRARWNKDATGGHAINAVLDLYQGDPSTSGTLIATLSVTGIGATEQEDTYTLSAAEADSITDYTDLWLVLSRQGDTGGNPNGRRSLVVDLVELEIPDAGASPVTVQLAPATATLSAQPLGLSLTAISTELAPATATLVAQPLGVNLSGLSVQLAPATATLTPQALGVSLGAKTVELTPATASLVAQALGVEIAGVAVEVELVPATITLAAQALGVTLDPLSVALQPATATLTPQALGVSLGAKTIALAPATADLVAQVLGVDIAGAAVSVELVPATLAVSAQPLGVSLSPLTVELTPATATLVAQALGVSTQAISIELTPAELTLVASVLGVDIVGGEDPFEALRQAQVGMTGTW